MSPSSPAFSQSNRDDAAAFFDCLFPYADSEAFISLRAFNDSNKDAPPLFIEPVKVGTPDFIDRVCERIQQAAEHPEPHVFCPPVFAEPNGAAAENPAEGLVLSVECDSQTTAGLKKLTSALRVPPTAIVASGGLWKNEAGRLEAQLHLHWRLVEPTRDTADHEKLTEARALAAELVGTDKSATSIVHPLRWPGSWHRKTVAIRGICAGEKSFTVESVLRFFPPEAYFERTGLSEHALPYSNEDFEHRYTVLYEVAGMDSEMLSYFIRTLLSGNRITYETVEKTSENLKSRVIEKKSPTGLLTSTTAAIHDRNWWRGEAARVDWNGLPALLAAVVASRCAQDGGYEGWEVDRNACLTCGGDISALRECLGQAAPLSRSDNTPRDEEGRRVRLRRTWDPSRGPQPTNPVGRSAPGFYRLEAHT
jgi:hypothetical protein